MLQTWLRTGVKKTGYWDTGATNFKQCCGLTADLVVDFIVKPEGLSQFLCFITELISIDISLRPKYVKTCFYIIS